MGLRAPFWRSFRESYLWDLILVIVLIMANCAAAPAQSTVDQSTPSPKPNASSSDIDSIKPLSRDEAVQLAFKQASTYQQAQINERIAAEDIRQAKAAFYPRAEAKPTLIYTSPSLASQVPGTPRAPSFLGANAITEYQALVNVTGEFDTAGRLRSALRRNQALLEAARAGTDVTRRDLVQAVNESYYALALATAKRRAAEQNLAASEDFERVTKLLLDAGEVAPVDLVRARLQTTARRDELEQARTAESGAADALRVFIGYSYTQPVATLDLLTEMPEEGEIERYTEVAIANRPEFAQFAAQQRAAEEEAKQAKAERRPQITYSIDSGFISDSLRPVRIKDSTGVSATFGVSIPLFDWGASKSRERQARLRAEIVESTRLAATRTFLQQFYTARSQALSAIARIRQVANSVKDAEQNVSASIARFRAGEAQVIEVTDALSTLSQQRAALNQAIFDYQIARTRLLQAVGK